MHPAPGQPANKARMARAVKLSILMPVYNEAETVQSAIKRVLDVRFPCPIELVVVDDASRTEPPRSSTASMTSG